MGKISFKFYGEFCDQILIGGEIKRNQAILRASIAALEK